MSTSKKNTRRKKSKGLGDTIEKVTEATGIKAVVKAVAGDDCGCNERKALLNELFPNYENLEMSEADRATFERLGIPALAGQPFSAEARKELQPVYARVFEGRKAPDCACGMAWRRALQRLEKVYIHSCEEEGSL